MARNALLLALAIAFVVNANGQDPAMPTAVEGQATVTVDPIIGAVPVAPGPEVAPIVEPVAPPAIAIVTPDQLMDAKTIVSDVFTASNGTIESCDRTKITVSSLFSRIFLQFAGGCGPWAVPSNN